LAFIKNITPSADSDAELVAQYKKTAGLHVLGDLYSRYMELVYGVCLKYLKTPEEAQDAVMAIFEELITKLQKHEVENFKSWLYTLAKNHCLMHLRRDKKAPVVNFEPDFMQSADHLHPDSIINKEEAFVQMEDCLESLGEQQKTVIRLFYLQNKCYNEIKELTSLEWNAVRSHIQNGRRALKICMEAQKAKSLL
jgi:RNA polymerase sigma factor (sigma-70 family)